MVPSSLADKIRGCLPRCDLGTWPTPIEACPSLAAELGLERLWVKREDRSATYGGGSKVRGLEFLLAGAPPEAVFVTLGATGSTHCLATTIHARALGYATVLAQFPQAPTAASLAVADATRQAGAHVVRAPFPAALPLAVAGAWFAARRLGRPRWIAGGGAEARGVVGQMLGGLELPALSEMPDALVAPLGSGGTVAGLALAVAALGWPTRVIGARVAPRIVANGRRVAGLARAAIRLLARHDVPGPAGAIPEPLVLDALGPGYGVASAAGEAAAHTAAAHGLRLEATYGAKTLATLGTVRARGFRRVVFWHTFAFPTSRSQAF